MTDSGFDRLARVYRLLEFAAFGRDLERARFCLLDRLSHASRILVLGEGDGRALLHLVGTAPGAEIHCVDLSAGMLARASARLTTAERTRVVFHRIDVRTSPLPDGPFDAVTTMFFLDCFTEDVARELVARIAARLQPDAAWLWADFRMPDRGWSRLRARALIAGLYAFFQWQTGIAARRLPPAETILAAAGFVSHERREWQGGMIRACLFRSGTERAGPGVRGAKPAGRRE